MQRPFLSTSMSFRTFVLAWLSCAALGCTIHQTHAREPEPASPPPAPASQPAAQPVTQPTADATPAPQSPAAQADAKAKKKNKDKDKGDEDKRDEGKQAKQDAKPDKSKDKSKDKQDKSTTEDATQDEAAVAQPPADPALQTIALPLQLPLSVVRAEIEKRVPAKLARGWELVTEPGKNPSIEAKLTIWRDPIVLRIEREVIHVEIPLRYAADIRGKAKTPFGKSVSLANGQTWGTKDEPQRITLSGQARVTVSEQWELDVQLALDPPKHGPPPEGSICTGGSFKLCVSKETIAPAVRKELDAEIAKRFAKLDEQVAKQVRDSVRLPKRVKKLWKMLGCAIPLDEGVKFDCDSGKAPKNATHWLVVDPIAADVSYHGENDALIVTLRMSARFERVEGKAPPRREVSPLPPRGAPRASGEPIELDANVKLDIETLRSAVRKRIAP